MSVATARRSPARRSALDRTTAMRLAATEYQHFVAQVRQLGAEDWTRPTTCTEWDVHRMCCHVLGMAEFSASLREQIRQMRAARRRGGLFIDALTGLQVDKHVHRPPADIVARLAEVAPRAARHRESTPFVVRALRMGDQPVDNTGSQTETWTVGYLTDVILTRDTWVHRSDIALATGREMLLTRDHDAVIVADVAAEWAERHRRPCALTLTGPAGGSWSFNGGGEPVELDAVQFCRIVSGRAPSEGLLQTRVPF